MVLMGKSAAVGRDPLIQGRGRFILQVNRGSYVVGPKFSGYIGMSHSLGKNGPFRQGS